MAVVGPKEALVCPYFEDYRRWNLQELLISCGRSGDRDSVKYGRGYLRWTAEIARSVPCSEAFFLFPLYSGGYGGCPFPLGQSFYRPSSSGSRRLSSARRTVCFLALFVCFRLMQRTSKTVAYRSGFRHTNPARVSCPQNCRFGLFDLAGWLSVVLMVVSSCHCGLHFRFLSVWRWVIVCGCSSFVRFYVDGLVLWFDDLGFDGASFLLWGKSLPHGVWDVKDAAGHSTCCMYPCWWMWEQLLLWGLSIDVADC